MNPNPNWSSHTWKVAIPITLRKTRDLVPSPTSKFLPNIKDPLQSNILEIKLQGTKRQPLECKDFD